MNICYSNSVCIGVVKFFFPWFAIKVIKKIKKKVIVHVFVVLCMLCSFSSRNNMV